MKNFKTTFQDIHYQRRKPNFCLCAVLKVLEFFYGLIINFKNYLYEKNILKEAKTPLKVICVGNLTTGGVGKTPIVAQLAQDISKKEKVAIISRGYGAKLQNKTPNIIKDFNKIYFENGQLCGDEPFQSAKKANSNTMVITCKDRKKAIEKAYQMGCNVAILDDGFSNRKVKKDKTILVIDTKMRFGNNHLLPFGPLREPVSEIKRADEIILVNKDDKDIENAIKWAKSFNKKLFVANFTPFKIYNCVTKAQISTPKKQSAIAFCAIGQPKQFFDFAKNYYDLKEEISFADHHKYDKKDIQNLIKTAKSNNTNIFITTQKDETKLLPLISDIQNFSFNILELSVSIEEIS